ncbi:hypothetical protein DFAR_2070002 [Desulfarculales bacterium]
MLKASDDGRLTETRSRPLTELDTGGFATAAAGGSKVLAGSGKATSVPYYARHRSTAMP